MKIKHCSLLLAVIFSLSAADVAHVLLTTSTEPLPPRPYAFGYAAGRAPGHIDRTHTEVSDGSGVVKGSFSYVDPRYQIRTVDYVADKQGFHPVLNKQPAPLPADSPVVAAAKERHYQQYAAIAAKNLEQPNDIVVPLDTVSVQRARAKHLSLYDIIAEEHAQIAALRKAERLAKGIIDEEDEGKRE